MTGSVIIASLVSAVVVVIVLGVFLWAAREDGRDQRRREASPRFPPRWRSR